jgi:serine protease
LYLPPPRGSLKRKSFLASLALVFLNASFAPPTFAQTARTADKTSPPSHELILLHKFEATSDVKKPEDIVDAVKNPGRSQQNQLLKDKLGSPDDAKFLIDDRRTFPPNLLRRSERYPEDDPPEVILQRYVVLTYTSRAKMQSGLALVRKDKSVGWAGENNSLKTSAYVSDPLAQPPNPIINFASYQWALPAINTFPAWDLVRGHAYVGHLDTGIDLGHPDLQFNYRPQFAYNPYGQASVDELVDFTGVNCVYPQCPGGHGTHTAGIIAANTTNSYGQYGHPSLSPQGIAGICWYCSLMVSKIWYNYGPFVGYGITDSALSDAIWRSVLSGAQVLNMSFGNDNDPRDPASSSSNYCQVTPYDPRCVALALAASRFVSMVAATGNGGQGQIQFPSSDDRTIAVGATQFGGARWVEQIAQPTISFIGSNTGFPMAVRGVVAPGRDVLSTFYRGNYWSDAGRCTDSVFGLPQQNPIVGYDACTGTSMAAPHVTGVVALMRSADPLLDASQIASKLRDTASNANSPNSLIGFGTINAHAAVASVIASTNRLTPLFSFYSYSAQNYFYTTVPQMGTAAIAATLRPNAANWYAPVGQFVYYGPYYNFYFPGSYSQAKAQAWIFTTHVNPMNPNVELRPLYRMSYSCADSYRTICATNPNHVDHAYATDFNEVAIFKSWHFTYDGIEGYVYPYAVSPQPANTEALIRAYNPVRDDHAIFPQNEWANMAAEGYTVNGTYLGYVYRNFTGSRPVY